MRFIERHFVLFLALGHAAIEPVVAASLPDTGLTLCYNENGADSVPAGNSVSIARDGASIRVRTAAMAPMPQRQPGP
jgi:hypothetical protein